MLKVKYYFFPQKTPTLIDLCKSWEVISTLLNKQEAKKGQRLSLIERGNDRLTLGLCCKSPTKTGDMQGALKKR